MHSRTGSNSIERNMSQLDCKKKRKMPLSTATAVRPEAELESRLATALACAFPNIPRDQLVEQHRFTVRVGRATYELDSTAQWEKSGRADILIFYEGRPLAVLEIKREDLTLTHTDYEQAQSYANQLTPRPPLAIVTNGAETLVYDANTGQAWSGEDDAAAAVARLLANAAKVAAADMRWATEALMGRETGVWTRIVRASTAALIAEMTDPPGAAERPFARDFLFPRLATLKATKSLKAGTTFTVIEGAPVTGKTSLLRELALRTADSEDLAVLMLRGSGPGLFQALANLFAAELEWNLTANDARQWLRRMSSGSAGPALVVAIDGVDPSTAMAADLEELASLHPGDKLRIILTTDRPEGRVKAPNGRTKTGLGAHATQIELGPLGLHEFKAAQRALEGAKIIFLDGAEYAEDYRAPWVLRTIYDNIARDPRYEDPTRAVLLPASLGLQLVEAARKTYADQTDLLRGYRLLARDALADPRAHSAELALAASNGFVIRQDALSSEARDCLAGLRVAGWVRTYRHASGEDIVVPTAPAAFPVELAAGAGDELERRAEADPYNAGVWLGQRLDAVYLGDLVGAQAIKSLADKTGGFNSGIVDGLLSIEPQEELVERTLIALATRDGRVVHIKIQDGKAYFSDRYGKISGEVGDLGAERSRMYAHTTAWMILGQLARLPTAVVGDDSQRMDAHVLFNIGRCPFPLLRVNEEGLAHFVHDLDDLGRVLCPDQGPIEAATQAMADLLSRPWDDADVWVEAVLESGSLPLVHRAMIALQAVKARAAPELSAWAHDLLQDQLYPYVTAAISPTRTRACDTDADQ
jgi:hypothetical protein